MPTNKTKIPKVSFHVKTRSIELVYLPISIKIPASSLFRKRPPTVVLLKSLLSMAYQRLVSPVAFIRIRISPDCDTQRVRKTLHPSAASIQNMCIDHCRHHVVMTQ